MKLRILSCFLIFALCFSMLSACGSDTAPSDHSPNSSLQTEISDSQDSTPVESSETDPAGTSDDDSSEGEAEPSQVLQRSRQPLGSLRAMCLRIAVRHIPRSMGMFLISPLQSWQPNPLRPTVIWIVSVAAE